MDLKKIDFTKPATIFKIVGLAIAAVLVLVFAYTMIGSSFKTLLNESQYSMGGVSSESAIYNKNSTAYDEMSGYDLSVRNIAPGAPSTTVGDTAEEYEVKEYNISVETRKLEDDCAAVADLKARADVIFEQSNFGDTICSFVFKVKKTAAAEVLEKINAMDPKEVNEYNFTIQNQVEDFTSRVEILQKKLDAIDETLDKAIGAYNEVTDLATRVSDVASLAKVIDSKINLIERLTDQRLAVSAELETISRLKAEQLDRVEYTNFSVTIYENKFFDGEALKDSWKAAVKNFVVSVNKAVQNISINLVGILFIILQILIYGFILLIVAKFTWKAIKYIWKK
jgi:hypothetical protein